MPPIAGLLSSKLVSYQNSPRISAFSASLRFSFCANWDTIDCNPPLYTIHHPQATGQPAKALRQKTYKLFQWPCQLKNFVGLNAGTFVTVTLSPTTIAAVIASRAPRCAGFLQEETWLFCYRLLFYCRLYKTLFFNKLSKVFLRRYEAISPPREFSHTPDCFVPRNDGGGAHL